MDSEEEEEEEDDDDTFAHPSDLDSQVSFAVAEALQQQHSHQLSQQHHQQPKKSCSSPPLTIENLDNPPKDSLSPADSVTVWLKRNHHFIINNNSNGAEFDDRSYNRDDDETKGDGFFFEEALEKEMSGKKHSAVKRCNSLKKYVSKGFDSASYKPEKKSLAADKLSLPSLRKGRKHRKI